MPSDNDSAFEEVPVNLLERERLKKKRAVENPPLTFFLTKMFQAEADRDPDMKLTTRAEEERDPVLRVR